MFKNKYFLYSCIMIIVFALSLGITIAYFTMIVLGNEDATDIIVKMSVLHITYEDGDSIYEDNVMPGWSVTKSMTITNDGNVPAVYQLYYSELLNELLGSVSEENRALLTNSELRVSATCSNSIDVGSVPPCTGFDEKSVAITNDRSGNSISYSNVIKDKIFIEPGETQVYNITYKFTNEVYTQNYNQNKKFIAVIKVKDDNASYNITLDGLSAYNGKRIKLTSTTSNTYMVSDGKVVINNLPLGKYEMELNGKKSYFELRTADEICYTNKNISTIYAKNDSSDLLVHANVIDSLLKSITVDAGTLIN